VPAARRPEVLVRAGEHFSPSIGSRLSYDQWIADGRTEPDVAREKVEEILATREAGPDPTAVSRLSDDQRPPPRRRAAPTGDSGAV
jgi:hypothetical protein